MSTSDAAAGSGAGLKENFYTYFQQQTAGSRNRPIGNLGLSMQLTWKMNSAERTDRPVERLYPW